MADHVYSSTGESEEGPILFNVVNQTVMGDLISTSYELIEPEVPTETYIVQEMDELNDHVNGIIVNDGDIPQVEITDEIVEPESNDLEEHIVSLDTNNDAEPIQTSCPDPLSTNKLDASVKCILCKDTFANFTIFRDHLIDFHVKGKLFKCKLCDKQFDYVTELKKHDSVHTGVKSFVCQYCGKGFLKRNIFEGHLLLHSNEAFPFVCVYCNRQYRLKEGCSVHIWRHEAEDVKHLECKKCTMTFYSHLSMQGHINKDACDPSLKDVCYQCQTCQETFDKRFDYIVHQKTLHPDHPFIIIGEQHACIKCGEIFNDPGLLDKHVKLHKSKETFRLKCHICNKLIKGKGAYTVHMKTHGKPTNVEAASMINFTEGADQQAMEEVRYNDNNEVGLQLPTSVSDQRRKCYDLELVEYQCELCPLKTIMTKLALENHISAHLRGSPYQCERCLEVFIEPEGWVSHLINCFAGHHPDEISCPACHAELDTYRGLKIHMRVKHKEHLAYQMRIDNVSFLKCSICDKDFLTQASLNFHKMRHKRDSMPKSKNFQCPFCPLKYSTSLTLMVHKRNHTGEKPFACKYADCGKSFKDRTSLRNHSIVHTKLYRHYCGTCNKGFVTPHKLKNHVLRTHARGIKPPKPKRTSVQ